MEENQLKLTSADQANFLETARWGKFLSIVGFVMSGFIVLAGLAMFGGAFGGVYPGLGGSVGIVYILFSLLYIFPSLYLFRFSTQVRNGIKANDQSECSEAYANMKRLFVFMGILTIVVLSLYALAILFMIMGGVMGGML
ncbi:DUF5362 family protein [Ekhidna sp.]|uniref:DUF5362 family protein n=1 Tax=Ekhidna sp. TaxID=2608089 RepID=UPI003519378B